MSGRTRRRQRRMAWLGLLLRIWALLALALALFITALPPPSLADVGQPDHDNASAAGLQLEAPLNEHEPVRDGGAGDAAQGDDDDGGGGGGEQTSAFVL